MNKKGFTLIELVMVIVILGILAAVAIPQYFDLSSQANTAAEKGVVGGVRAGLMTYYAQYKAFPADLDTGGATDACDTTNPCFNGVLTSGGITADWTKSSTTEYTGPAGNEYTYDSGTGSFN